MKKNEVLAFAPLNLRFNPFGALSDEEWLDVSIVNIDHLEAFIRDPRTAVQFLADHGRGKTTHLRKLYQKFPQASYVKLCPDEKFPRFTRESLRFVDGIENAIPTQRLKIYKKTTSIAFTTHSDLTLELEKQGYHVITERISCACDMTLLEILNARIEIARDTMGRIPLLEMDAIKNLRAIYGDNIRAMQYHLYNEFQKLKDNYYVHV